MKNLLLLIFVLTYGQIVSACPISGGETACVANIQPDTLSPIQTQTPLALQQREANQFKETPSNINQSREIKPVQTRNFGSNSNEYGYNSSCQFGVCLNTGTPKIFRQKNN